MPSDPQHCMQCGAHSRCELAEVKLAGGSAREFQVQCTEYPLGARIETRIGLVQVVRAGAVKAVWTEGGRQRILDFCFPGRFIGLNASLGLGAAQCVYETLARTRVCSVTCDARPGVGAFPECECLAPRLAASIMPVYARARMMRAGANERVARYVLDVMEAACEAQPGRPMVLPAVARADIANYLGLRAESVSRALVDFRARGWIRGKVEALEVLDPAALRGMASATE